MQKSDASESAAKKGILAGALLTAIEVVGGLLSGSLGLLSSSINSLFDSIAAVITYFAVRESNKPPDEVHHYGHEKIESAAAIAEIILLFIVCSWIVYNAYLRLMSGWQNIELYWLALGTNFASIFIDLFAYLRLKASSKERRREAIEAGALHFLNDLLIAVVVIVGLVFYWFGIWYADSIAALCIVFYVIYSSLEVVRESFKTLMDVAPTGFSKKVKEQILSVEGVKDCHRLRIRRAGSKHFVDAHITLAGGMPLYQAHSVASSVEERITRIFPDSDILIHTEPYIGGDPIVTVRNLASQIPEIRGIHGITVKTIGGDLSISYHIELEPTILIKTAHDIANRLEHHIKESQKNVSTIVSHLEPVPGITQSGYSHESDSVLVKEIERIAEVMPGVRSLHEVQIMMQDGKFDVTLHCMIDGSASLVQAHETATKMEEKIRSVDKRINQVDVHCEPQESH